MKAIESKLSSSVKTIRDAAAFWRSESVVVFMSIVFLLAGAWYGAGNEKGDPVGVALISSV
jgi:hypothetical protein